MIEAQGHHGRLSFKSTERRSLGISNRWARKAGGGALQGPGTEGADRDSEAAGERAARTQRGRGEEMFTRHTSHRPGKRMARDVLDSERVGSLRGEQGFLSLWLPEPLPAPGGGTGACPGGLAN